jgi:hypothetical protein
MSADDFDVFSAKGKFTDEKGCMDQALISIHVYT